MRNRYYSYSRNYFKNRDEYPSYKKRSVRNYMLNASEKKTLYLSQHEKWFINKWEELGMNNIPDFIRDKQNMPFGVFIPELVNTYFRYAILIDDGLIKNTEIENQKEKFIKQNGYQVFKIKAYSQSDLDQIIIKVKEIRKLKHYPGQELNTD